MFVSNFSVFYCSVEKRPWMNVLTLQSQRIQKQGTWQLVQIRNVEPLHFLSWLSSPMGSCNVSAVPCISPC